MIRKEQGNAAADQWILDVPRGLPEGERGSFTFVGGRVNMPGLQDALKSGVTPEESVSWLRETVQLGIEQGRGDFGISSLLSEIPVEQRIEVLKQVRGPGASEAMKNAA